MGRVGTPPGSRGSQWAFFAQEKDIAALAASLPFCQGAGYAGPVCVCFASLGTALSLVLFAQMTWRPLTVEQFVIAVVKISASSETSPTRCLLLFSIHASVRTVLGHLVSNKQEIPYFILM